MIVLCGAIGGVAYLAVEPAARRWWPWSLITTRRLLDGRLRDRAIWADGLLGIVVGLASVCLRLRTISMARLTAETSIAAVVTMVLAGAGNACEAIAVAAPPAETAKARNPTVTSAPSCRCTEISIDQLNTGI